jgi:nitrate/nitrite-specific signal transduction histidine kinase
VQEMLQNLSQHIPQLDKLLAEIEQAAEKRWQMGLDNFFD